MSLLMLCVGHYQAAYTGTLGNVCDQRCNAIQYNLSLLACDLMIELGVLDVASPSRSTEEVLKFN